MQSHTPFLNPVVLFIRPIMTCVVGVQCSKCTDTQFYRSSVTCFTPVLLCLRNEVVDGQ